MGTVPVMATADPDTVLFMTTGDVETADPVYARPRVGDALEATDKVPKAAIAGLSVTVSPIINPFVLATWRFSGLETDTMDVFEAEKDGCDMGVPLGMEYGYVEKTRLEYAGPVVGILEV